MIASHDLSISSIKVDFTNRPSLNNKHQSEQKQYLPEVSHPYKN